MVHRHLQTNLPVQDLLLRRWIVSVFRVLHRKSNHQSLIDPSALLPLDLVSHYSKQTTSTSTSTTSLAITFNRHLLQHLSFQQRICPHLSDPHQLSTSLTVRSRSMLHHNVPRTNRIPCSTTLIQLPVQSMILRMLISHNLVLVQSMQHHTLAVSSVSSRHVLDRLIDRVTALRELMVSRLEIGTWSRTRLNAARNSRELCCAMDLQNCMFLWTTFGQFGKAIQSIY